MDEIYRMYDNLPDFGNVGYLWRYRQTKSSGYRNKSLYDQRHRRSYDQSRDIPCDEDIIQYLPVTLEEILTGATKTVNITRKVLRRSDLSVLKENKILSVDIKPGWKPGTRITIPEEGDQVYGEVRTDVIFILEEKPHPLFIRRGHDIVYHASISLKEALCGLRLRIPTLDGSSLSLIIDDVIAPEAARRIPGEGLPVTRNKSQRGDLVVEFDVRFPSEIEHSSIAKVSRALALMDDV